MLINTINMETKEKYCPCCFKWLPFNNFAAKPGYRKPCSPTGLKQKCKACRGKVSKNSVHYSNRVDWAIINASSISKACGRYANPNNLRLAIKILSRIKVLCDFILELNSKPKITPDSHMLREAWCQEVCKLRSQLSYMSWLMNLKQKTVTKGVETPHHAWNYVTEVFTGYEGIDYNPVD